MKLVEEYTDTLLLKGEIRTFVVCGVEFCVSIYTHYPALAVKSWFYPGDPFKKEEIDWSLLKVMKEDSNETDRRVYKQPIA